MRLLWIRHGQMEIRAGHATDVASINRLFTQEVQGGLSERGQREAQRVAEHLGRRRVDALMASPLQRARETGAVSAAALGLELEIHEGLLELRTGGLRAGSRSARVLDGLTRAPLPYGARRALVSAVAIPLYFDRWRRGLTEGGERLEDFVGRVDRLHLDLRGRLPEDAVVGLFAHGYLIFSLAMRLASSTRERAALWRRPYIPNGAITEVDLEASGRLSLVRYADAAHLRQRSR